MWVGVGGPNEGRRQQETRNPRRLKSLVSGEQPLEEVGKTGVEENKKTGRVRGWHTQEEVGKIRGGRRGGGEMQWKNKAWKPI